MFVIYHVSHKEMAFCALFNMLDGADKYLNTRIYTKFLRNYDVKSNQLLLKISEAQGNTQQVFKVNSPK